MSIKSGLKHQKAISDIPIFMQNSDYNTFGFKNNFGVRVLSTLEIGLMKGDKDDMSVYFNTNKVEREYFRPIAQDSIMFSKYFNTLDIDISLGVNQNSVIDYGIELENHGLDTLRSIFIGSTMNEWIEKPLYFYTLILCIKKKIDQLYGAGSYNRLIDIEEKGLSVLDR